MPDPEFVSIETIESEYARYPAVLSAMRPRLYEIYAEHHNLYDPSMEDLLILLHMIVNIVEREPLDPTLDTISVQMKSAPMFGRTTSMSTFFVISKIPTSFYGNLPSFIDFIIFVAELLINSTRYRVCY